MLWIEKIDVLLFDPKGIIDNRPAINRCGWQSGLLPSPVLIKHKEAVLRFAVEEEVPFTNNQAERDIRPTKIKQKMNGGFRSENGTESYCRIQSFISSLRKQSRQVFQELLSVIEGNPFELFQT